MLLLRGLDEWDADCTPDAVGRGLGDCEKDCAAEAVLEALEHSVPEEELVFDGMVEGETLPVMLLEALELPETLLDALILALRLELFEALLEGESKGDDDSVLAAEKVSLFDAVLLRVVVPLGLREPEAVVEKDWEKEEEAKGEKEPLDV